ncbi:DUF4317 domain-containing protein [[Bacteroides] pectinophilus]|jgi:hypothetical protein|uniref:DUF4317 domain-containing protein n=2 Tax=[Bacteroides] pectinophilus TaxID=384638 RepID=B7AN91_9FIRM|nr:hypothetical protein BACPEC_00144 [[Bacteroides] pectinophilus ATCC 43243]UWN95325.1 DUF4317 domain-containing protein [[Bacteroides] pectinophilus]CDD57096.1 putative uncharacterized protein [Bacteroides pectinophilus CAG:437]HBH93650.1 DUF4317 domain-containing protein [Bacteroides sp.]
MNKKEISEIKKLFANENSVISTICGCYVDGDKNKKSMMREAFLSLPQDEMHKYMAIFRKCMTGTLGRNILNMEFADAATEVTVSQQKLMDLRDSELKDDAVLETFYDEIIANYNTADNYLILLVYGVYDVPGRTSDGIEMEDASDEIYRHILCCICPVKLSKPGLSYNSEQNGFHERIRDWVVDMPAMGFLYPAFNERSADVNSILYYSSKAEELKFDFVETVLGCTLPMTAGGQKETFQAIIQDTLGDECEFEVVKEIHEQLTELIEEKKDDETPLELGRKEVVNLLAASGVDNRKIEELENNFEEAAGGSMTQPLLASNVASTRKFEIKTPDVVVQVKPDRTDLVETRMIDNVPYLLITLSDSVQVNGIDVRMPGSKEQEEE